MKKTITAGGVVINKNGEVVVVSQGGTSWSLPKGHVEKGEDLLATAKREITEETGLTNLQLIRKLGHYERPKINDSSQVKIIHMFLFMTEQFDLQPIDPHNPHARWVTKNEVADLLTAPKDKEFFESVIRQVGTL